MTSLYILKHCSNSAAMSCARTDRDGDYLLTVACIIEVQILHIHVLRRYANVRLLQTDISMVGSRRTEPLNLKMFSIACQQACIKSIWQTAHNDERNLFSCASVMPQIMTVPYSKMNISAPVGVSENLLHFLLLPFVPGRGSTLDWPCTSVPEPPGASSGTPTRSPILLWW